MRCVAKASLESIEGEGRSWRRSWNGKGATPNAESHYGMVDDVSLLTRRVIPEILDSMDDSPNASPFPKPNLEGRLPTRELRRAAGLPGMCHEHQDNVAIDTPFAAAMQERTQYDLVTAKY